MSETKTIAEYQLVVEQDGGPVECGPQPLADVESRAAYFRKFAGDGSHIKSVRIEKRQVTYGPWSTVEEATRGSEGEK